MAVLKDGNSNYTAKVDSYGSMRMVLVGLDGNAAALTIGGSVEISNDVGNPLPIAGSVSISGSVPVTGTFFPATQPVSLAALPALVAGNANIGSVTQGAAGAQAWPVSLNSLPALAAGSATIGKVDQGAAGTADWPVVAKQSGAWAVSVSNFPADADVRTGGAAVSQGNPLSMQIIEGGLPVTPTNPLPVIMTAALMAVTQVGASAASVTATLPAPGAGLFHYITKVEIDAFCSVARTTAVATPITVATANLPGSLAATFGNGVLAVGVNERYILDYVSPLKSVTANTATTVTTPANTNLLWRVTVYYFVGP